ncbi:hypothetical protein D3C74_489330 [compost metagenome]
MFVEKWVLTSTCFKRLNIRFVPGRISQRNGDISQPAQMPNAANRRTFGNSQEIVFVPGKQFCQLRSVQRLTRTEIVFLGEL